jgi:uncharacterized membrane protein YccC
MKKITFSVDEKVLCAVRRIAAEQDQSVNALVRDYLTGLAQRQDQTRQDRPRQARRRLRKLSERSKARIGSASWRRDELHAR